MPLGCRLQSLRSAGMPVHRSRPAASRRVRVLVASGVATDGVVINGTVTGSARVDSDSESLILPEELEGNYHVFSKQQLRGNLMRGISPIAVSTSILTRSCWLLLLSIIRHPTSYAVLLRTCSLRVVQKPPQGYLAFQPFHSASRKKP